MSSIFEPSVKGQEAFHRLDTVSDSKSALESFQFLVVKADEAIKAKAEKMNNEISAISKKYLPSVANPMIAELRTTFNRDRKTAQNKLNENLNKIIQDKEEVRRKYVVTPPSADQIALLQTLKMRDVKDIPSEEWNMLASTLAGNYQCASVLAAIAKDAGKDFVPPFSPEESADDIKQVRARCEFAVQNIGSLSDSYIGSEFLAMDNPDTFIATLFKKLDTEIPTTVPADDLKMINRLKQAANVALDKGQFDIFNQIYAFIADHRNELYTPEEAKADFIERAEGLIDSGMNAQEAKPGMKYTEHRDRVISKLEEATGDKE